MRRSAAILALVLGTMAIGTPAQAQPLKFSVKIFETAPLVVVSTGVDYIYEGTLVNVGPNEALGSILLCSASTGVCSTSAYCSLQLLLPGHACTSGPFLGDSDDPVWARMVLIRFGDKKAIDARAALEVRTVGIGSGIEALPR